MASKPKSRKRQRRPKGPQPSWLRKQALHAPVQAAPTQLPPGAPRLLTKKEVCALARASFPSIWSWMRANKFPRARIVNGRSMWVSTEVEAWLVSLPQRRLKGDPAPVAKAQG